MSIPVVAIDGPSASGKGTVASQVARRLGFHYLESGALYRLVALVSLRNETLDEARLAKIASSLDAEFLGERILLEKHDVTEEMRSEACSNQASLVAPLAKVRSALLDRQRSFRRPPGLVADGRDMGTIVFPDAALKIFLTASPAVRAERRYKQLIDKGFHANLRTLSRDLEERDARDAARPVAPLAPAPDALRLDSSNMTVGAVVEKILGWCRERNLGGRA
jgi:cytidylate kinase